MLYYARVWSLVFNEKKPVFSDEFQAWIHGPANPTIYRAFKSFDFSASHPDISAIDLTNEFSEKEKEILDMVWNVYGKYDGKYLETLTHSEEPWQVARQGLSELTASKNIITDESMISFYERRLETASRTSASNC